jgi:hypothetical protein
MVERQCALDPAPVCFRPSIVHEVRDSGWEASARAGARPINCLHRLIDQVEEFCTAQGACTFCST